MTRRRSRLRRRRMMVIGIDNGDNDEAFKLEMNEGNIVIPSSKHLKDSSGHT